MLNHMLSKTHKDHFGWPCSLMFAFLVHALSQITCTLNEKPGHHPERESSDV